MINSILKFEIIYRLRQPLTPLLLLLLAGQGIWFAMGIYDFNTNDEALVNGAGVFYQCLAAGGMLVIIVVAMITGTTLYRDISCNSADYVYALPINEKRFLLGHFLSAYCINLILVAAYPMGMAMMKYLGIVEPHLLGPVPVLQLIHGYVIFTVPNLFILSVICYFCLIFFRKMAAVYIGIASVIILFLIGESMSTNSPFIGVLMVLDPFGYVYAKHTVAHLPVELSNSGFMPFSGLFLLNRFLWLGLSGAGLYWCYRRFSFQYFIENPSLRRKEIAPPKKLGNSNGGGEWRRNVPLVTKNFSFSENLRKMLRLSLTEFYSVVRPAPFRIIFGIIVILIFLQNILWNSTYYIGYQVPLTSGMTHVRLVNGFLFTIILMVISAELFFRERTSRFWEISGTTPAPNWVVQLPKLLAMAGVSFLVSAAMLVGGVLAQIIQGYWGVDWLLYFGDLFGFRFGWCSYMLNIVFVFFLAGLLGNRYATHIIGVGVYIFVLVSVDLGLIEELRFTYSLAPGAGDYSEMNGYGIWAVASRYYSLLWLSLAGFFILASLQLWRRGAGQRFLDRRRILGGELSISAKIAMFVFLLFFLQTQSFIVDSVNIPRNFISSDQADAEAASYEEQYGSEQANVLLKKHLYEVKADFYPSSRKLHYSSTVTLTNVSSEPVERLFTNIDYFTEITSITADRQPLELVERNPELGMSVYLLPTPLIPGESTMVFIQAVKQYTGFTQSGDDPQPDLTFNGSFFTEVVPFFGFDEEKSLRDNRDRELHSLDKLEYRLPSTNQQAGLMRNFISPLLSPEDELLNITVSTLASQTPLGPGKLIRKWRQGDRMYSHFQVEGGRTIQPYLGSAVYSEHRVKLHGVDVTFLHNPDHTFNLSDFTASARAGIAFINASLGIYPHEELRIAEIPFYQDPSYALANTIALSEKEGWFGDTGVGEVKGYIQFVIARDLIRQWFAANASIARVQGADMLWSALPSALALQVVRERLGQERVEEILAKLHKKYRKERANEPNIEQPLLYGDDIEYLEKNKGVIALYKLSEQIGFVRFNAKIADWVDWEDEQLVFKDLYLALKKKGEPDDALWAVFEQTRVRGMLLTIGRVD